MKKLILIGALLVTGGLALQDVTTGHGGTYRGPGDTVPPGGGGGGGAGGPGTAGPAGPTGPTTGPVTPGATTGGAPGGGPGGTTGPITGAGDSGGTDLTVWQFWWGFNKDPYLNLRAAIQTGAVATGSDEFFLGRSEKQTAKDTLRPSEEQIRQTIVPALLQALETERQNDIVTGCLIALAKIGDAKDEQGESKFEQVIKRFLKDPTQEIAETAAVALGILANPASIDTLEQLAKDTAQGRALVGSTEVNYRTRAFACYGLGLIGYSVEDNAVRKRIAQTLIEICQLPQMSTRDVHVAALIALGLVPVNPDPSAVITEGEVPTTAEYYAACRENQIRFVLDYFKNAKDNHFLNRAHCPRTLAKLLDGMKDEALRTEIATALLEAADKRSKEQNEVMQSGILALGLIGDCDADAIDQKIRKGLADSIGETGDQQAKFFAVMALAQVGGRAGSGEGSEEGYKFVKKELTTRLARSGAASGGSRMKPWLGLSLGVMQHARTSGSQATLDPEVAQVLRSALIECKTPADVGAYCIGAGLSKDLDAKKPIVDKLDNFSDDEARGYAAVALGLMGAGEEQERIQKIVRDSKYRPDLLKQAAIALGLLGDKELVPELIDMLRDAKGLATQASISSALGFIGDARSVDPLVEMLKNQQITASARGFAAVALGIVADKEMLPWNSKISRDINYRANTTTITGDNGTGILDIR